MLESPKIREQSPRGREGRAGWLWTSVWGARTERVQLQPRRLQVVRGRSLGESIIKTLSETPRTPTLCTHSQTHPPPHTAPSAAHEQ